MERERWNRIEQLYHAARQLIPGDRDAFLKKACAGDESLRTEVESLLACRPQAGEFIEAPAIDIATAPTVDAADLTGQTVLHYRITERLGAGGMGVVYKAQDLRLGRSLALKFLSGELSRNKLALERFQREARAASALNHPHICTLYDVGEHQGRAFIVMEYLAGQTLAGRLDKGPLPLDQTLEIGAQIADALDAAHKQGVIHRDLKPGNIMLTASGAKLLDFGLAKLRREPQPDAPAAESTSLTEAGMILGTLPYMAPEQLERRTVDARTDVWALGVILYEMLAGRRPFEGPSQAGLIATILEHDPPPLSTLRSGTPPELGRLIMRCLAKDPDARWQSAADLAGELRRLASRFQSGRRGHAHAPWLAAGGAVLLIAATILIFQFTGPRSGQSPDWRSASFTQLTRDPGTELSPSLSPDGKFLVYAVRGDIWLQRVGGEKPVNLTVDSPADDTQPAFSPDGQSIAFRSERDGGGIYVMGATGESARRLANFGFHPSWSPDGKEIVIGTENISTPRARMSTAPAWVVTVQEGEKRQVANRDAAQPVWSPHNRRIAFWARREPGQLPGRADIWTMAVDGTDPVAVTHDEYVDWNPAWSPDGRFLYFASDRSGSGNIWRVPIDEESGRVLGALEAVTRSSGSGDQRDLTLSGDGKRIVYSDTLYSSRIYKVPFDPVTEKVTGAPVPMTQGSRMDLHPALSPDGSTLAFNSFRPTEDIWVMRADGSRQYQLSKDSSRDRLPRWSPDGEQIVFHSNRSGRYEIWTIGADGTGLRQVTESTQRSAQLPFWYPDGSRILYTDSVSLWSVDARKAPKDQVPVRLTDSYLLVTSWSSDGRDRLAATFRPDPGVVVYSMPDGKIERYTDFGMYPVWLNDNRRLVFRGGPVNIGDRKLYILDTKSRKSRAVYTAPGEALISDGISISRDNRTVYYPLLTLEADLWMISVP